MIIVCPLSKVQSLVDTHGARRVLSMLSPERAPERFAGIEPEHHLWLGFHDIVQPMDGMTAPTTGDAERLVGFISGWDRAAPMVIHCWAGISRSTAAAFTALCLLRPRADEEELALELRAASPSATPNRLIVSYTDAILGRSGRMVRAIDRIGRGADAFEGTPFTLDPGR